MLTEYSRDLRDEDRPIAEAVAERPGKPIRIRIQPMILRARQYHAWKDVRWTLECETPSEALATRDAMKAFFQLLSERGPEAVTELLVSAAGKTEGIPGEGTTTAGAA